MIQQFNSLNQNTREVQLDMKFIALYTFIAANYINHIKSTNLRLKL